MNKLLACLLVVSASGCPDVKVDPGETTVPPNDGPTVEFDPAKAILPFPNNLVIDPTTHKVNIPAPACETPTQMAIRTGTLNKLDGFGTYEAAMQVTFTEAVDETTLAGNIVMFERTKGATSLDPASAVSLPLTLIKGTTVRLSAADCTAPATIDAVTIIPMVPLDQKSTYTVAVLDGVKTTTGKNFIGSATWALVNQKDDPVTLDAMGNVIAESTPLTPCGDGSMACAAVIAQLQGLDQLWKAHAQALGFLAGAGHSDRTKILVAWEVTTQTTTDPLDPTVAGTPANTLGNGALQGTNSLVCNSASIANGGIGPAACPGGYDRTSAPYNQCVIGDSNAVCFMKIKLGQAACGTCGNNDAVVYGTGSALCQFAGCSNVGDILAAALGVTNYQTHLPNPLAGGGDIPGAWSDPINPVAQPPFPGPPGAPAGSIGVLIFIPTGSGPFPTVVFGHGLGSSQKALFAIGGNLAGAPIKFASVAIDDVAHGSRAVRISNTGVCADGAGGPPDPTSDTGADCYQQIFSADLAQTRDNIRESILDMQRLTLAVKACGTAGCASANSPGSLTVDTAHIVYLGQSLGGILGTTVSATAPDIKSTVLDVPAVGWLDILENTQELRIRCGLVDALIDGGLLVGDKWNKMAAPNATGLCSTDAWKVGPVYAQFAAVARWIIDPGDGANFMTTLNTKKRFIQEVVDDGVVPNVATDREGALAGLTPPAAADLYVPVCVSGTNAGNPCANDTNCPVGKCGSDLSMAVSTSSLWLRYTTLPANASTGFPGNTYWHGALLKPLSAGNDARLATARLQTDAIGFLTINH